MNTAIGVRQLLIGIAVLLAGCREPSAPPMPPKVHSGLCTIAYKYWIDRADHSQGAFTITWRAPDSDSCPDEIVMTWDDDR